MKSKLTLSGLRGKVVIDCIGYQPGSQRGIARLLTHLLTAAPLRGSDRFVVLVGRGAGERLRQLVPECVVLEVPVRAESRVGRLAVTLFFAVLSQVVRPALFISAFINPLIGFRCPVGVFVLDLLPFHFPHVYGAAERVIRQRSLRIVVRTADRVFTISETSKADICTRFGVSPASIYVIPCGSDIRATPGDDGQDVEIAATLASRTPLFFSLLGGREYKNPEAAVSAFCLVRQAQPTAKLVLIAHETQVRPEWRHIPGLIIRDGVSDALLVRLYQRSAAFVFPSRFEGFGIPVIEAQALGTPVVCSNIQVLREVSRGNAILVDPQNAEEIAAAMVKCLVNGPEIKELTDNALRTSAEFTWERAAMKFLQACDDMVREAKPKGARRRLTAQ